tara:strand:- start:14416 stop:15750 length:1335 start_codon:yes stop_codon:yes gene_type:complete
MAIEISVPYKWTPRDYQLPLWSALENGCKRAAVVWHRRAGKDSVGLNWTVCQALQEPGIYWHLLPTSVQGRKVVWEGKTNDGRAFLDHWPPELITKSRDDEMALWLRGPKNSESMWQVVGSDNYDRLVGANPRGVVFSEFSLAHPNAWEYIRPILAANNGWALFLYTPRGRNHGYDLYQAARRLQDEGKGWFAQMLTVDDTHVVSPEIIEEDRASGMPEEMIQQEYWCSFNAALVGSYYGEQMARADTEKRICSVRHDTAALVETWWDLGIGDPTAIWFVQRVGREVHLIDYYESQGQGLAHYVSVLDEKRREHGYNYGDHVMPHDAGAKELGSGKTRVETLSTLGLKPVVLPLQKLEDGIEAVRNLLAKCWFDETKCDFGLRCLREYSKNYDEKNKVYQNQPRHDFTSHAADAFRYGAMHRASTGPREPIRYPADHFSQRGII